MFQRHFKPFKARGYIKKRHAHIPVNVLKTEHTLLIIVFSAN